MIGDLIKHMTADEIRKNYSILNDLVRISNTIDTMLLKTANERAMCDLDPRRDRKAIANYEAQFENAIDEYQNTVKLIR